MNENSAINININAISKERFDFSKNQYQILIIQSVRLAFLMAILVITLAFQSFQPEFVNLAVLFPIYVMMTTMFVLNAVYLIFLEFFLRFWMSTAILFFIEATFISGLIYFTGINQSIFLFLYLVNIILCGFVFGRKGAIFLSLWTSTLFSLLLIVGPEMRGQTLIFAIGLNNIAFFAVSFLSGILSEQINFMGSELQAQGKDLRALKNLNVLILENISTGLVMVDPGGNCLQANRAAADILEVPTRLLLGRRIDELLENVMLRVNEIRTVPESRTSGRFDWSLRNSDGERLILEIVVSTLVSEEGEFTGFVLAFQDLTKVRRLEFAMRQAEKMAAVGQLAAGIAHEIRNPLASISGSIQLLGSSFSNPQDDEKKLMAIVLKEIDRLNNLITEFLEYVRPDMGKDDPVDINSLLREILDMVKLNKTLRADTDQKIELQGQRRVSGSRDKLKQAFLNIIINGYQAMQDIERPVLEVSTRDQGPNFVIKIRDHGCGIEEVRLRKIFDPFHTTKPRGTGLGLAVTHKVIETHGGKIYVESTKGVGTEFTLEFPVRNDNLGLADSQGPAEDLKVRKRGNG